MNEREGPTFPSDWLEIARKDWTRTLHMLDKEDAEAASFFFQQSLEKYLKAFLLQHGWKLRKIHELDALLDNAAKHNPGLEDFRDLCVCPCNVSRGRFKKLSKVRPCTLGLLDYRRL